MNNTRIEKAALIIGEDESARILADRINPGPSGSRSLAFAVGNTLGPELARRALEQGYQDRAFSYVMRQKVQEPFIQDMTFTDTRETGLKGTKLEPKLRLICVPADDVPESTDDLRICDEARMVDRALKANIANYERNRSKDTVSPLSLITERKSRLFALTKSDAGIERIGELKRPNNWDIPRIISPLQYLAASIMKDALERESAPPDYTPIIERTQSVESAVGSGRADIGFAVIDEEDLPQRTAAWRRGGLRPIRLTEDARAGSLAFNNDVLFGGWDPRPCDSESRERVQRQMEPFPGFYATKNLPLAKPTGEDIKEPPRNFGDWQSIH